MGLGEITLKEAMVLLMIHKKEELDGGGINTGELLIRTNFLLGILDISPYTRRMLRYTCRKKLRLCGRRSPANGETTWRTGRYEASDIKDFVNSCHEDLLMVSIAKIEDLY